MVNKWAVCILLECILVPFDFATNLAYLQNLLQLSLVKKYVDENGLSDPLVGPFFNACQ